MLASEVKNFVKTKTIGDGHNIIVDMKNSQGSWLVDLVTKKRYLDCYSQFASQPLGWNHPKFKECKTLNCKIANSDLYTIELAEFIEDFSSITTDFNKFFFIEGGTLAVENALKAAFDWKAQLLGLGNEANVNFMDVIHLKEAFHGRSGYALSITNTDVNKIKWFPKFPWTRIINPKSHGIDVVTKEKESLEQAETALKKGNVAAIILETIQGEGGDNHFRLEYLTELRNLADKYEALLIFDEVQAGMGITGKMWAYQHYGIIPDLLCFGKKVQTCGFCSTSRIDSVKNNVFHASGRINSTWGGNLNDMMRFSLIKKIIEEEKLVDNAAQIGDYFLRQLLKISGISNVRGKGLMLAFDLANKEQRDGFMNRIENSMLVLKSGENSIRLRPHLDFTQENVDLAVRLIECAL